jgi:hypothetical protein
MVVSALAAAAKPPVQGGGVDQTTVVQHHAGLAAEEGRIGYQGHIIESGGVAVAAVEEAVAPLALHEDHLEELLDVAWVEIAVGEPGAVVFLQVDEHLSLAVAPTADFHHGDRHRALFEVGLGLGDEVQRPVRAAAGACSHKQDGPLTSAPGPLQPARAPVSAGVVSVACRAVGDARQEVGAGMLGRVGALGAAGFNQSACAHDRPTSVEEVGVSAPAAPPAAASSSSRRASSFSTVR